MKKVAVADVAFKTTLGESVPQDTTSVVTINEYQPNKLIYTANSPNGGVVVFSEIYYPEWTATVDGNPVEIGRVNYVLRALHLSPGKHEIVLDFHPTSVDNTEMIAYTAGVILLLAFIGGIVIQWRRRPSTASDK